MAWVVSEKDIPGGKWPGIWNFGSKPSRKVGSEKRKNSACTLFDQDYVYNNQIDSLIVWKPFWRPNFNLVQSTQMGLGSREWGNELKVAFLRILTYERLVIFFSEFIWQWLSFFELIIYINFIKFYDFEKSVIVDEINISVRNHWSLLENL